MVVIIRFFQMNWLWHPYCLPLFRLSFWMSQTLHDCLCVCLLCFCLFLHVFWPECLNSHSNLHPPLWKKRMAETCWRHQRCWSATVSTNCIFFSPWPFADYNKLLNGKTYCNGERQMNCNDGFPVSSEVVIWSLEWQRELILLSFLHAVPFRGGTANQLPPSHPWPVLCILNSRPSLTTSISPPLPLNLTPTTSNLNFQIQRTSNDSNVSVIVAPASGMVKRQPDLLKTTEVGIFHKLGYLHFQSPL